MKRVTPHSARPPSNVECRIFFLNSNSTAQLSSNFRGECSRIDKSDNRHSMEERRIFVGFPFHKKNMTSRETDVFVDSLLARSYLVSGELGGSGRHKAEEINEAWKQVGLDLQAQGFDAKDEKTLQKKWTDLKYRVRAKARNIESNRLKNPGGEKSELSLTAVEEKVLLLAGVITPREIDDDNPESQPDPVAAVANRQLQVEDAAATDVLSPLPVQAVYNSQSWVASGEKASYLSGNDSFMEVTNQDDLDQNPVIVSENQRSYHTAQSIPKLKIFKKKKRLPPKTDFDKVLEVEQKKLKLEETRTDLMKKRLELKEKKLKVDEKKVEALTAIVEFSKEKLAIAKEQLAVATEILSVLKNK